MVKIPRSGASRQAAVYYTALLLAVMQPSHESQHGQALYVHTQLLRMEWPLLILD